MTEHPQRPEDPSSSVSHDVPPQQTSPPTQPQAPPEVSPPPVARPPATTASSAFVTSEDQRWSLIAHYGAAVILVLTVGTCGSLAGLLTLLLKGASPVVRAHAVESLNFQLTWGVFTIVGILAGLLTSWTCVGLLFGLSALLSGGFAFGFAIIGGRYAARGILYRYPISFRVVA
ncbi:MAG: DUF4870 domain-containing protein [Mycobacteriales bacterium]